MLGEQDWSITEVSVGGVIMNYPDDFYIQGQQLFFGLAPQSDVVIKLDPTQTLVYDGGTFTTTDELYEEVQEMGEFRQPENYNQMQLTTADIRPLELLNINVQTNRVLDTYDNDTRTFTMIQDNNGNMVTYDLTEVKTTITTQDVTLTDNIVEVLDINKFDANGYALLGTELVKYIKNNNELMLVGRGLNNTFVSDHIAGTNITDVDVSIGLSTIPKSDKDDTIINSDEEKKAGGLLNEKGKSILDSDATFYGNRIINSGKGIAI